MCSHLLKLLKLLVLLKCLKLMIRKHDWIDTVCRTLRGTLLGNDPFRSAGHKLNGEHPFNSSFHQQIHQLTFCSLLSSSLSVTRVITSSSWKKAASSKTRSNVFSAPCGLPSLSVNVVVLSGDSALAGNGVPCAITTSQQVHESRQCNGVVQLETWFLHFGDPSMPETSTQRNLSAECFITCVSFNCFVWIEFEDENESFC